MRRMIILSRILDNGHGLNKFLGLWFMFSIMFLIYRSMNAQHCPIIWHGGSPLDSFGGSCYCGKDTYCMCTPSLAIDAIIEVKSAAEPSIVLVRRRDNPKDVYAIPGGYVDVGETVEDAALREAKEETNLSIMNIEQYRVYSDPSRDKRRHTVSCVMRGHVRNTEGMHLGDDAKGVEVVPLSKALSLPLAFDHREILTDYIKRYHT